MRVRSGLTCLISVLALASGPRVVRPSAPDPGPDPEGIRLLQVAREADRSGDTATARPAYLAAADRLPLVGDWLRLRAAALDADSLHRAAIYVMVRTEAARLHVGLTEAIARERFGDAPGALREYQAMGRTGQIFRLQLMLAGGDSARDSLRRALVAYLDTTRGQPRRDASDLLESAFSTLPANEALTVARAAAADRDAARVVRLMPAAFGADLGTAADRFAYASALAQLGRHRDAAARFALIPARDPLASQAGYQRARSLQRAGNQAAAVVVLRRVKDHPGADSATAAMALFLMAELTRDSGRYHEARDLWRELARRFPRSREAPRARMLAGLVTWLDGRPREAAKEWGGVRDDYPRSDEAPAAGFWAGRAYERLGDTARAWSLWRDVIVHDSLSYYAVASAARLGGASWMPMPVDDSFPAVPAVDSAGSRIALLRRLDLGPEAGYEGDWLLAALDTTASGILATARVFRDNGQPGNAIRLGWKALQAGAPADARTFRLIFPLLHRDQLTTEAARWKVEPALVAALIRQESNFEPSAQSSAGARGLMQVMPSVGKTIATRAGVTDWDPDRLYEPDLNISYGVSHLAEVLGRYADLTRVLAAYNAGGGRVAQWARLPGADDPDVFLEWISIPETRNYVRVVRRNRELYRFLYEWSQLEGDAAPGAAESR